MGTQEPEKSNPKSEKVPPKEEGLDELIEKIRPPELGEKIRKRLREAEREQDGYPKPSRE